MPAIKPRRDAPNADEVARTAGVTKTLGKSATGTDSRTMSREIGEWRTAPPDNPHPLPDCITRPHFEMLLAIRQRVLAELREVPEPMDRRFGFGLVLADSASPYGGVMLDVWRWRHPDPTEMPERIGKGRFADQPLGMAAHVRLGARMAVAQAFAAAANDMLGDSGIAIRAHPVEIAAAAPGAPCGIFRGANGDVLVIDLLQGETNPRIIDRLLERELALVPIGQFLGRADHFLRLRLWHRAERINVARSMLGLELPPVRVPGVAALQRRIVAFTGSEWGYRAPPGQAS